MITVYTVPEAFSPSECDRIVEVANSATPRDAKLVRQQKDHNYRRAQLVWLDEQPDTEWVMDRIIDLVRVANRDIFDFDVTEFAESAQVATYHASAGGHFDWHSDIGEGRLAERRKLTMVVQLSEPDGYKGGKLEVMTGRDTLAAPLPRGTATFFPSFMMHRVSPVTSGTRQSLTIWCHGTPFR
jgi:PKHD-type hydroxylase